MYRPFIDDLADVAPLDGQRHVVLRPAGAVRDAYSEVQGQVKERLRDLDVSYPAHPHVTLANLAGAPVEAVRALVAGWAPTVPPLVLDIERVSAFPTPFRIVIIRVRKTPKLVHALSSLRARAQQRGIADLATIAPADWVFHLSLTYCSKLSATAWAEVEQWIETVPVQPARSVVSEAEVVAFDTGRESSGGVFTLAKPPVAEGRCRGIQR